MPTEKHGLMLELIKALPEQLLAGYDIGIAGRKQPSGRPGLESRISSGRSSVMTVLGMGGSGISGGLLAGLVADSATAPVTCCRDYDLPASVTGKTLVVAISYSGNTEETLSAFDAARARRCPVMVITSGGQLMERAHKDKLPLLCIPTGLPPRAALGLLFGALLAISDIAGLRRVSRKEVVNAARLLTERTPAWRRKARTLVRKLADNLPVVYATDRMTEPVADRWRCQLNENAKLVCHSSVLPEHNHNEIVGMGAPGMLDASHIFTLLAPSTHPRTRARLKHLLKITSGSYRGATVLEAEGESRLAQQLSLVMIGDLLSYELALARDIDPLPVERIDELKRRMAGTRES